MWKGMEWILIPLFAANMLLVGVAEITTVTASAAAYEYDCGIRVKSLLKWRLFTNPSEFIPSTIK